MLAVKSFQYSPTTRTGEKIAVRAELLSLHSMTDKPRFWEYGEEGFEWRNDKETNLSFPPSRRVSEGRGCGRDLPCQLAVDLGRQSSSSFQLVESEGDSILSTL